MGAQSAPRRTPSRSQASKAQAATRAKGRQALEPEKKKEVEKVTLSEEGGALLLYGLSAFLLAAIVLAIVHAEYADIPLLSRVSPSALGKIGQVVGTTLREGFGLSALLLPWILFSYAVQMWTGEFKGKFSGKPRVLAVDGVRTFGFLLPLSALFLFELFGSRGGGSLGGGLDTLLHPWIGRVGILGSISAILLLTVPKYTSKSVRALTNWGVEWIKYGGSILLVKAPKKAAVGIASAARGAVRGINAAGGYVAVAAKGFFTRAPKEKVISLSDEVSTHKVISSPRKKKEERIESKEESIKEAPRPSTPSFLAKVKKKAERIGIKPSKEGAFEFPSTELLTAPPPRVNSAEDEELEQLSQQIKTKLQDFNIQGEMVGRNPGPVITLFEFRPAAGVKVGRIASLQDDLAMGLRASAVRILAPIPNKDSVGVEVPNRSRETVHLREVLESEEWEESSSCLSIALGKDTSGVPVVVDIASMPHLLIAGATGTGKSVCINSLLISLLYRATPEELGLILIDPKILELSVYDGIPHLKVPVVTVPRQAKAVLDWAVKEMDRRYRLMQRFNVRNIDSYNKIVTGEKAAKESAGIQEEEEAKGEIPQEGTPTETLTLLPKIVIVIDELADLMLQVGREIEELITRLAQKARAAGIHLIVATQRPSVDVITGLIKANFPARMSFRVTSRIDSRTILDSMGAERLLGKGDMLFMQPGANPLKRIHGAFVSDQEVQRVIAAIKQKGEPQYDERIMALCERALKEERSERGDGDEEGAEEFDPLYDKAVEVVVEKGQASTSMIQRAFRIGYNRAARIIEMMEREGVIGPADGIRPREILAPKIRSEEGKTE